MALTPLQETYDRNESAYTSKLNAVMGIFQSLKASQVRKQQVQEGIIAQKELIDYQANKELQVVQAKGQNQQMKLMHDALEKSRKAAVESVDGLSKTMYSSEYGPVTKYNLLEGLRPTVEAVTTEDGVHTGYRAVVVDADDNPVADVNSFRGMLAEAREFGQFIEDIDGKKDKLEESGTNVIQDVEVPNIGSDNVDQIINAIKTDKEARNRWFSLYKTYGSDALVSKNASANGGPRTKATGSYAAISQFKTKFDPNNLVRSYSLVEKDFLTPNDKYALKVDYTASVTGVKKQIDHALSTAILEKSGKEVLKSLPNATIKLIVAGASDEAVKSAPKYQEEIKKLAQYAVSDPQVKELLQNYAFYGDMFNEYLNVSGQTVTAEEVSFDPWNAPSDLQYSDDFKKLFKPINYTNKPEGYNEVTQVLNTFYKNFTEL